MDRSLILFLTNSELGQASISLATAHEFLIHPSSYAVHIASFSPLRKSVAQLNDRALHLSNSSSVGTAVFHNIPGPSMKDLCAKKFGESTFNIHGIGFFGALKAYKNVLSVMLSIWDGPKYVAIYNYCVNLIHTLQPVVVVVDPLFYQALDACRMVDANFVVLSPNTFKDHVPQPKLANLWKYPAMCSGYSYPLSSWLIPANAYLIIKLVKAIREDTGYKTLTAYRNDHGISGPMPSLCIEPGDETIHLIPGTSEAEFPCVLPEHFITCGPILRPCAPIAEEDPELAVWLSRRPTVLINLGSLVVFDSNTKRQFAHALRVLLEERSDVQILLKMQQAANIDDTEPLEKIQTAIENGQVRIESWLNVDPLCILQSGQVVCVVHHGGANSYYECIRTGIPQIILPVWFDTYDFASRVEWLGIGVWGSKKSAPAIDGHELKQALLKVLVTEADAMSHKARAIASQVATRKEGRVVAFEKIVDQIPLGEEKAKEKMWRTKLRSSIDLIDVDAVSSNKIQRQATS